MKNIRLALLFLLTLNFFSVFAQPGGDPGGGGNPSVPITGIEVLLGIGGALGVKKLVAKRKPNL